MAKRPRRARKTPQPQQPPVVVPATPPASAPPGAAGGGVSALVTASYSGPLPPPGILEGYDRVVPGAAKRILRMVERQGKHRIELEKAVIASDVRKSWVGLWVAAALAGCCIIGGVVLVFAGHDAAGTTIATATVASLVGVFVYGTSTRRRERVEKAQKPAAPGRRP